MSDIDIPKLLKDLVGQHAERPTVMCSPDYSVCRCTRCQTAAAIRELERQVASVRESQALSERLAENIEAEKDARIAELQAKVERITRSNRYLGICDECGCSRYVPPQEPGESE